MAYLKPQNPIQLNDNYIYPLTTADQVMLGNGNRLNSLFKKTIKETATLQVANWSDTTPYTQTITLTESTDDYNVDANVAYGDGDNAALNKAAGCISYIKKNHKEITFYCLKSKPEVDIPVEITGTCRNTIATVEEGIKLNFDIVGGTTQPKNPKENTIWVNTDVEINNWIFNSSQPKITTKFRYIKLEMDALNGTGSTVQFSDIRFLDNNREFFTYPSGVSVSSSITAVSTSEGADKLVDNNASTKFCSTSWISNSYILIDLGETESIDINKYNTWQLYSAHDSTSYPERNLKNFSLWGSNDGKLFQLLDSVTNCDIPSENSVVVYDGTIYTDNDVLTEGGIWICTGGSSDKSFNTLKNNAVYVHPISAYQYINNLFVKVDAMIYQNNKWIEWNTYLYNKGDECSDITGGWSFNKGTASSIHGIGSGSKGSTSITISADDAKALSVDTNNKIDVTDASILSINVTSNGCQQHSFFGIRSSFTDNPITSVSLRNAGTGIFNVDVSEISGSYYISVYAVGLNTGLTFDSVIMK